MISKTGHQYPKGEDQNDMQGLGKSRPLQLKQHNG